jgi:hypothetical protein
MMMSLCKVVLVSVLMFASERAAFAQSCCPPGSCGTWLCGGPVDCGVCAGLYDTCGGGGAAGFCGCTPGATPNNCFDQGGLNCGVISDGCGGQISCGTCTGGQSCVRGLCQSCSLHCAGQVCGPWTDSCGQTQSCGSCAPGETCSADHSACLCAGTACAKGQNCIAGKCSSSVPAVPKPAVAGLSLALLLLGCVWLSAKHRSPKKAEEQRKARRLR